jgi:hypothetical protein
MTGSRDDVVRERLMNDVWTRDARGLVSCEP